MKYWIERWVELRKKEFISCPQEFPISDVYLKMLTCEELRSGFKELQEVFVRIYEDILEDPLEMFVPAYDMNQYGYFSKEARLSREESYKYAKVLYILGCVGEWKQNGGLHIPVIKLKEQCKALKVTNIGTLLNVLTDYGFVLEGLMQGKIKKDTTITVLFPDNKNLITALYILAVKARNTNRFQDFCRLNYRLYKDDWSTIGYDNGVEFVADLFPSEQDRKVAGLIHKELIERKYYYNFQEWNEGPQIRYYRKEGDCKRNANASFWLVSMDTEIRFYFRTANMEKALEYVRSCPESVIGSFLDSDPGCAKRMAGSCVSGVSYQLNGNAIWRCGCCNPNFQVVPTVENYLYYINAVEAGNKKR